MYSFAIFILIAPRHAEPASSTNRQFVIVLLATAEAMSMLDGLI